MKNKMIIYQYIKKKQKSINNILVQKEKEPLEFKKYKEKNQNFLNKALSLRKKNQSHYQKYQNYDVIKPQQGQYLKIKTEKTMSQIENQD